MGWHGALRNVLTDLRFAWQSRAATGDVVVVAIDAPSIEQIGVWPWPRRLHAELLRQLDKRRRQRHRVRRRLQRRRPTPASDAPLSRRCAAPAARSCCRRSSSPAPIGATSLQPPAAAIPPSTPGRRRQRRDRSGRAGPPLPVRREARRRIPALDGRGAGRPLRRRQPLVPDRLQHPRRPPIPKVSYIDVLRGDPATLDRLKGSKIIIGGTALELGDRFSVPNGGILAGPVMQALAAESILQGRVLHWTSEADQCWQASCLLALVMMLSWRRLSAGSRAVLLGRLRSRSRPSRICCRRACRSRSTPRCSTSPSSSTSQPSRSTKSISAPCSAGSPKAASSASRCRSATA